MASSTFSTAIFFVVAMAFSCVSGPSRAAPNPQKDLSSAVSLVYDNSYTPDHVQFRATMRLFARLDMETGIGSVYWALNHTIDELNGGETMPAMSERPYTHDQAEEVYQKLITLHEDLEIAMSETTRDILCPSGFALTDHEAIFKALDTFGPQKEVDMIRSYAELRKMFSPDVVSKLEDWFDGVNYNEVRHRSKEAFEIAGRDPVEHLVNVCSKLISGAG